MSVRSRTTNEALPRSVTNARQRLEGGGQELLAALGVEAAVEGDAALPVGGDPDDPQAAARRVVTASIRIHPVVLMVLQPKRHAGRLVMNQQPPVIGLPLASEPPVTPLQSPEYQVRVPLTHW